MIGIETESVDALARHAGLDEASIVIEPACAPGAGIRLRADAAIYPASMIKLPIAMVLAAFCDARAYAWTDDVVVDDGCVTTNDAPSPFESGYRAKLGEAMHAMLAASDNVATNVLIDVLGRETLTAACVSFGLAATAIRRKLSGSLPLIDDPAATGRNAHPAADVAQLLHTLARDTGPGTRSNRVHDALAAQIWNDKLSRGLAPGDTFVHKTGDTDEVSHDGGILMLPGGRRFVVVVYTPLPSSPDTDARHAAFMRALRPHLG